MTRISDTLRPCALALMIGLCGSPLASQELVTDAFGILPLAALDAERAGWAGMQTRALEPHVVRPTAPETVLLYVSPKTLVAGDEFGQVMALAYDGQGNLVADGDSVQFTLGSETLQATTHYGNANATFFAGTGSGSFLAGAQIGNRQSGRASYDIVADLETISVALSDPIQGAPQETIIELGTRHLADAYGNTIPDGIGVQLILAHGNNRFSYLSGVSRDGTAQVDLLTRDIPMAGALRAVIADTVTPSSRVTISSQGAAFPVNVAMTPLPRLGGVTLRIGPITTDQGYLLNDGAQIDIIIEDNQNVRHEMIGWIRDGYFESALALSSEDGPFRVTSTTTLGRNVKVVEVSPTATPGERP